MSKVKAIQLDGQTIYMQVDESVEILKNEQITDDDFKSKGDSSMQKTTSNMVEDLQSLIKTMTNTAVNAVTNTLNANVDKITLEFSVKLGAKTGFIIASGEAEGSVKISVDLKFPKAS